MTKLLVNNNIYYREVSSKPNVEIIGITLSMRKQHIFETIFTSDDFLNIQDSIVKGFNSREIEFLVGVNSCFGPKVTNIPHENPNYGHGQSKFEIYYYRQTFFS